MPPHRVLAMVVEIVLAVLVEIVLAVLVEVLAVGSPWRPPDVQTVRVRRTIVLSAPCGVGHP